MTLDDCTPGLRVTYHHPPGTITAARVLETFVVNVLVKRDEDDELDLVDPSELHHFIAGGPFGVIR